MDQRPSNNSREGSQGTKGEEEIAKVAAIVLAAGESTRMGEPKQLLPLGDSTIIEHVVNNLLESEVSEVIVVLGYQAEKIAAQVAGKPVKIVLNPDFQQGMSSSIKCGLSHISETSDAIMIFLGDQPVIDKEIINKLVEGFVNSKHGIIAPVYGGTRGHPVVFDVRYKSQLSRLEGDIGARKVIEAHPDDILEVEVKSESILTDIDTINDYQSHISQVS